MRIIKKLTLLIFVVCCSVVDNKAGVKLVDMGVEASGDNPRTYSYSDKEAGFYYGNAGIDNWNDWYAGWNIRAKRIFADYRLSVDGKMLNRSESVSNIYPDCLVREFDNAHEKFYLVDSKKILYVAIGDVNGSKIGLELLGDNIKDAKLDGNTVVYTPIESPENVVRVAAKGKNSKITFDGKDVIADASCGGFIITFGSAKESAALVNDFRNNGESMLQNRAERMQSLLDDNVLKSDTDIVDNAMAWIDLTADELVTKQHGGWGIYAGFPWFTDFWGRDMFISMPGTVLCTGQFDVARSILGSFAKYQDLDPKSPNYGRIPNRLNLEGVLYNTTDGTPRFVAQIYDYWKYTGDFKFVKELYKNVKVATDASLDHFTDEKGYLTHADADTWMDAKRQSKYPCSPRGNRAVDIQALWYKQLICAAEMAESIGKDGDAKRWHDAARRLKANFMNDFVDKTTGRIYDHLNADGSRDMQLRPNTMFVYDLVPDSIAMADAKNVWSRLVYPWGVSTLDQDDDQFHPYHEQWYRYHKDDAYHNGTVWLWLNGQAMENMIRFHQEGMAYELFENMCNNALHKGAVGGLSECADAWALPGRTDVRLSGTFLQAWSNAEQIRVWNQCFLGIRPDMIADVVNVRPAISSLFNKLKSSAKIGDGKLAMDFEKMEDANHYKYTWSCKYSTNFVFDIEDFKQFTVDMSPGAVIDIITSGNELEAKVIYDGKQTASYKVGLDNAKIAYRQKCDKFFEGVGFAKPSYRENLKSMSRYFDPPLDYQSIE